VLAPLGMTSTVWSKEDVPAGHLATAYTREEGDKAVPIQHERFGEGNEGAGGLYSSVRDMARYVAFQLAAYPARSAPDEGIYAPEWTERTYAECLRRAGSILAEGGRVVVDANFVDESRRRAFLDAATRLGVRSALLHCRVSPDVAKARIAARTGDASDKSVIQFQSGQDFIDGRECGFVIRGDGNEIGVRHEAARSIERRLPYHFIPRH
jgi:predicted kinase